MKQSHTVMMLLLVCAVLLLQLRRESFDVHFDVHPEQPARYPHKYWDIRDGEAIHHNIDTRLRYPTIDGCNCKKCCY